MNPETKLPENTFVRIYNGSNYKEYKIDFLFSRGEKNVFEIDFTQIIKSYKSQILDELKASLEKDVDEISFFQ